MLEHPQGFDVIVIGGDHAGTEAALTVTDDADDDTAIGSIGYIGTKRYLRVVATGTTGTDATVAGTWALQCPRYAPKGDAAAAADQGKIEQQQSIAANDTPRKRGRPPKNKALTAPENK